MIELLNEYVFGVSVPIMLIFAGIFFCIRLKLFWVFHPLKTLRALRGGTQIGEVSSAKALSLALAGTLGVGNMVGVASAIALGGNGAIFWMWVSAFLAMTVKYAEIVLAMRYRRFDADGRPYGAAMYYVRALFGKRRIGAAIALIFALFCVLNAVSMGGMIQVGAASNAVSGTFGIHPLAVGISFSLIAIYAVSRGASGILSFTEKLVPFMSVGFAVISVAVICIRPNDALEALKSIFEDAFTPKSALGGVGGFLTSRALRYGTMRGILSNEAGCGTAPAAHATSDCSEPARQGVWGMLEVFVDTVLLCTLTAIVVIVGKGSADGGDYMMMTLDSYRFALGGWAAYFIALAVMLFALATVLCWGHYGLESVRYISKRRAARRTFTVIYSLCILIGSVYTGQMVWETTDLAIGVMTLINLTAVLFMSREVGEETERYFGRRNGS